MKDFFGRILAKTGLQVGDDTAMLCIPHGTSASRNVISDHNANDLEIMLKTSLYCNMHHVQKLEKTGYRSQNNKVKLMFLQEQDLPLHLRTVGSSQSTRSCHYRTLGSFLVIGRLRFASSLKGGKHFKTGFIR